MSRFTNEHFSYSRLSRFEQCPKSFDLHYLRGEEADSNDALRFGSLLHEVLEAYFRAKREQRYTGKVEREELKRLYRERWAKSPLTGSAVFAEGLRILDDFPLVTPWVDHRRIAGIEQPFTLRIGEHEVVGFIDRIDRDPDTGAVEVIDYKTNRLVYSDDELATSLQLSIYALAAREMFPNAPEVKLTFHLLRHALVQSTTRDDEQLDTARAYVETLARQIESAEEFPARFGPNCAYCDHRRQCPAYARALLGEREETRTGAEGIAAVALEWEQVSNIAKAAYARKRELEDRLKARIEQEGDAEAEGRRFSLQPVHRHVHPRDETVALLAEASGLAREDVAARLLAVDGERLDRFARGLQRTMGEAEYRLLRTRLAALAEKPAGSRVVVTRGGRG